MLRILYSDLRRTLVNRLFIGCLSTNIAYQVGTAVLLKMIMWFAFKDNITGEDISFVYSSIGIFLVTVSTLIIVSDFSEGTMRNKLISGAKRSDVFISTIFTSSFMGMAQAATAFVTESILRFFLGGELISYTIPELADFWIILTLASVSVAVFSTSMIMMIGGKKIAYFVGLLIAFAFKIISMEVTDKLYPDSGNVTLTGFKLAIYTFYDRFVPYAYFSIRPHWDTGSYILGCVGLMAISTIIGLLVFNKKELQ
ncbi:MAG: hypothetical protein K5776_03210 [Lachnospiraceae bacterium]|nr:hypothetical protein [Lachnospiraceae bacterium]